MFLSSTFTDLKEERAEVIQALWELDCIPTGMEAFLASNLSQWEVIQRVIDECDYYILIIGGRYGSLTDEGISYTEKEFNYARGLGIPVLAFVHGKPDEIAVGKSEVSGELRRKLETFRTRVMKEYPVREWTTAHELGALASRSLIQETKRNPRPGWIRNDGASPVALLQKIDQLTTENAQLREKADVVSSGLPVGTEELASGSDVHSFHGTAKMANRPEPAYTGKYYRRDANHTWDDIFRSVGLIMLNEAPEREMRPKLADFYYSSDVEYKKFNATDIEVSDESFAEIIIQLRALGLIDTGVRKRGVNDRANYWRLTEYGDRYLVSLLAKRKRTQEQLAIPFAEREGSST